MTDRADPQQIEDAARPDHRDRHRDACRRTAGNQEGQVGGEQDRINRHVHAGIKDRQIGFGKAGEGAECLLDPEVKPAFDRKQRGEFGGHQGGGQADRGGHDQA